MHRFCLCLKVVLTERQCVIIMVKVTRGRKSNILISIF